MADLGDPTFWIPTAISMVAVVLLYLDMRGRIKREETTSTELAQLVKVMREELELFRKQTQGGQLTTQELLRQRTLQSQSDATWKNLTNLLKTAKLFKEVWGED